MLIIGVHQSISKGFYNTVQDTVNYYNTNALQIFLKSPQMLTFCKISDEEANKTKEFVFKNNLFIVGHCSYLLNFAKEQNFTDTDDIKKKGNWAINSLIDDLLSINKIGGYGVVLHTGKYVGQTKEDGIKTIAKNIKQAIYDLEYKLKDNKKLPYIIIENTAGQGTEIGITIEELSEIYELLNRNPRIKFCIDTAHAFASGYDIKTKEGFDNFIKKFNKLIGIENIGLFHFNDSKKELGSRVDRHDSIGIGLIGDEGLKRIAEYAKEKTIPIILETPDKEISHLEDIKKVKNWFNK